jgi:hypothetical protein
MFEKARWSSFSCWSVSLNCRFAMHKLYDFVSFSQLVEVIPFPARLWHAPSGSCSSKMYP